MRALLVAAVVFVAALAGCSSKKGDDDHDHLTYTCPNGTVISEEDYEGVLANITVDFLKTKCPKGTGSGSGTNSSSQAPNVLPTLNLTISDFAGNASMITLVDGNLTFDATGSKDSDGQISAIAISVQDANTTRTRSLYNFATKTFTPVTFVFDRAGPVNVSVAMVDDRAGFTSMTTMVYVNDMQVLSGGTLHGPADENSPLTHPCTGASGALGAQGPLVDAQYFKPAGITIVNGATFIEATPNANTLITICAPDGTAISSPAKSASAVTSTNEAPLMITKATENYQIGFYVSRPNVASGATVIVHYEPRAAA